LKKENNDDFSSCNGFREIISPPPTTDLLSLSLVAEKVLHLFANKSERLIDKKKNLISNTVD